MVKGGLAGVKGMIAAKSDRLYQRGVCAVPRFFTVFGLVTKASNEWQVHRQPRENRFARLIFKRHRRVQRANLAGRRTVVLLRYQRRIAVGYTVPEDSKT